MCTMVDVILALCDLVWSEVEAQAHPTFSGQLAGSSDRCRTIDSNVAVPCFSMVEPASTNGPNRHATQSAVVHRSSVYPR
jgi:hypothetical protein